MALRVVVAIGLCTVVACGDDATVTPDGGADAEADAADGAVDGGPAAPTPPAEAAMPTLGPCPEGWRTLTDADEITYCDPYPEAGRELCTGGEAHFVGTPGCARVGSTCPADGLPADVPAGSTVHWVSSGAAGTGTRASPYSTIAEAVAAASAGDVIAVGRGVYDESVGVPARVTIIGACVGETSIAPSAAGPTPAVYAAGPEGFVRNLTVGPTVRRGIEARGAGRSVTVQDVVVSEATGAAIGAFASGAIDLRRVAVDEVRLAGNGFGIQAEAGGTITGESVDVVSAAVAGLYAFGPDSRVTLSEASIGLTTQGSLSGIGVIVQGGAEVEISNGLVDANAGAGGFTQDPGTTLTLDGVVIRGNLPTDDGEFGRGLNFEEGATGRLSRCLIQANRDVAIFISGGTLDIEDSVIRDTESELRDERGGLGIEAQGADSTVNARRVVLANNSQVGALISAGAMATAEDLTVLRTRGRLRDGSFGLGIQVQSGGMMTIERALLEENRLVALGVAEGMVIARDLVARRTLPDEGGIAGRGLDVEGGSAIVERASFEDNADIGVFASLPSTVDLADITVRGSSARAVNIQQGASGTLRRLHVEDSREVGVWIGDGPGPVTLEDVVIRGVTALPCMTEGCTVDLFGIGLFTDSSPVTMTRFDIDSADLCGLQIAGAAGLDLMDGTVHGNTIGACVQIDAYDFDRLTNDVRYLDNEVNLDTTSLPVPPPQVSAL